MEIFRNSAKKISSLNFDKKIKILIVSAMVLSSLIIFSVCTLSYVNNMTSQLQALLNEQNTRIASNLETSLDSYRSLSYSIILDDAVQEYLDCPSRRNQNYSRLANAARGTLEMVWGVNPNLNFIAIVNENLDEYLYRGSVNESFARFSSNYGDDYEDAIKITDTGMRISFNDVYYGGSATTLNVYFPIYNTKHIGKRIGLICMNFERSALEQITTYDSSNLSSDVAIIYRDGSVISSSDESAHEYDTEYISGEKGEYWLGSNLNFYKKTNYWPFYVVSSVSYTALYGSSFTLGLFLAFILIFVLLIAVLIVDKMIKRLYRPLKQVVNTMDVIARGRNSTRVDMGEMGEDFTTLASGFNSMMDKIDVLLDKVKEEEHQIAQTHFNMLQSQIQPHFLYNTLECIHWQAEADGNKKISTMVKALAKYYRICLSSGKELISIQEELEHVRCYLVIQNMRYGDIIESEIIIDKELKDVLIPKITLQPLVENSIYHGIKVKNRMRGKVSIIGVRDGDNVQITVQDTGTGMTEIQVYEMNKSLQKSDESFGYGVRNVNRRINLVYGAEFGLKYKYSASGGATVIVTVPFDSDKDGEKRV